MKVRIALSPPLPTGQTDEGEFFLKSGKNPDRIETEKIRTETGQTIFEENPDRIPTADRIEIKNPDKNEIKTGHGQCCPPTSGW